VRETLFNWLQPVLPGARVLDLFAGTGALGLEAVSRGAASAHLVEARPGRLGAALQATVARLGRRRRWRGQGDALALAGALEQARPTSPSSIRRSPPGCGSRCWRCCRGMLAADAWLYVESPAGPRARPAAGLGLHREGRTRDVRYALYRRVTLAG
jgi:16S rRNA (guanine966-N2)-methyltransferase